MSDDASRMSRFTAMAETEYHEERRRQEQEEAKRLKEEAEAREIAHLAYSVAVRDAAQCAAARVFGQEAAELLKWHVTERERAPQGTVEAAVTIRTLPHALVLTFHALLQEGSEPDAGTLADAGTFGLGNELGRDDAPRWAVRSLAELGELLAKYRSGELSCDRAPIPAQRLGGEDR